MLTTALKVKRVAAQQKVVDTLTAKVETHKVGLNDAQQSLKLAVAELSYRKSAPTFDPEPAAEVVETDKIPADAGATVQVHEQVAPLVDNSDEPSF